MGPEIYKLSILSLQLHVKEQYERDRGNFLIANVKNTARNRKLSNITGYEKFRKVQLTASVLNSKLGRTGYEGPNRLVRLTRELVRGDLLAAGEELVTGFKVPSDPLELNSGHSENLDFTPLFFVLRYTSSM